MSQYKQDHTKGAFPDAPALSETGRRRWARGHVSGIAIPGTYRWRLNEASDEAFLSSGPMPPSPSSPSLR